MRRLICISNSIADTFKWRTSMGLSNDDIIHFSPYADVARFRVLDPEWHALVWIDRPRLDAFHHETIEAMKARGMKEYTGYDHTLIRLWLERAPTDEALRTQRRAHDIGEYVIARLVQIIRVAVTCWAIEQRVVLYIKQRAPHCADARRHALEDIAWELEVGYHRREVR